MRIVKPKEIGNTSDEHRVDEAYRSEDLTEQSRGDDRPVSKRIAGRDRVGQSVDANDHADTLPDRDEQRVRRVVGHYAGVDTEHSEGPLRARDDHAPQTTLDRRAPEPQAHPARRGSWWGSRVREGIMAGRPRSRRIYPRTRVNREQRKRDP